MPLQQAMPDFIVLIPGILGSVLVKDGREVWGASGSSVASNLMTFGKALGVLELPHGIGHDDPKDGVTAPRVSAEPLYGSDILEGRWLRKAN